MALVLCTGVNRNLVATRKMILEEAGHTVVPALSDRDLIQACEQHDFDVAVIGQAISSREKNRIYSLVRLHCPSLRVLELYSPHEGKVLIAADDWLAVPADVPTDLADHVSALADSAH
jgi:hypothetical protein